MAFSRVCNNHPKGAHAELSLALHSHMGLQHSCHSKVIPDYYYYSSQGVLYHRTQFYIFQPLEDTGSPRHTAIMEAVHYSGL